MSLRYDGVCVSCRRPLPAKTTAWWDRPTKQVTCTSCRPHDALSANISEPASKSATTQPHLHCSDSAPSGTPLPPPPAIDHGVGGISAAKEYERRKAKHDRQIEANWGTGRLGRFAKFMSDEPQSTTAWAKGADGERRLARRLNDELNDIAVVLHDRKVPNTRGNIDHLVIAPNGIWIIDAKNYSGKVEQRDVGGWFSTDVRLYVGNRNQTKLVDELNWQVEGVRAALTAIGFGDASVHPSICFTNSEWGLFAKPIRMNGVIISWAANLIDQVRAPGPLDASVIKLLARHLSAQLPASR
jgi:hypothetical protein